MAGSSLTLDRPTRREREVNWGDRTRLAGAEQQTLAWVSVAESGPMVVYATAGIRGGSSSVACVVNVEWGHGGASVNQDYVVVGRLRVPLAASMVKVSGRLLDAKGAPPPASVIADVSVVIAPGLDGETTRNTRWHSQEGASGELGKGPLRVMRLEGYNAGPADTWVMFFDGRALNGDTPAVARPVRARRSFVIRRFDSQPFRSLLSWSASSTPLVLTKDPAAQLRVDAEFLL
jgi:hypothetical protein